MCDANPGHTGARASVPSQPQTAGPQDSEAEGPERQHEFETHDALVGSSRPDKPLGNS